MSEAMVTEREAVGREHGAFLEGVKWAMVAKPAGCRTKEDEAEYRYPVRKYIRLRVVPDPHDTAVLWAMVDGYFRWRWKYVEEPWRVPVNASCNTVTPERVRLWADLLANPTEEVEA